MNLEDFRHLLLLSLKAGEKWIYNPPREQVLGEGDVLVFMTSPQERADLERLFRPAG